MSNSELVTTSRQTMMTRLEDGYRLLAEASSLVEAKLVRDLAQATADLVRQQQLGADSVAEAMTLKLWAERKLGEMLRDTVNHEGGRPKKLCPDVTVSGVLPEEVSRKQSSRWQKVASVPEVEFRAYLQDTRSQRCDPTTQGVLRLAARQASKSPPSVEGESPTCTLEDLDRLIETGKKYGTIYADPPWQYGNQATRAATDANYPTMTLESIAALPIEQLAAEESHLHLWTTNAFLRDAFDIVKAWGFEYKSVFVWVKPQMGIGNYWRVSHEFMLLGVRGGLGFGDKGQKSWLSVDRDEHSVKPRAVRRLVEKVSPPPRLELFGRRVSDGWTVWGNNIERTMFDQEVAKL